MSNSRLKHWFQQKDEKLTIPPRIERSFGSSDELQARGVKLAVVQVPGGSPVTVSVGTEQTREMYGGGDNTGPLIVEHETEELSAGKYCVNVWHSRTAGTKTATFVNGELASQTRYGQEGGVWTVNETLAKPKERRLW